MPHTTTIHILSKLQFHNITCVGHPKFSYMIAIIFVAEFEQYITIQYSVNMRSGLCMAFSRDGNLAHGRGYPRIPDAQTWANIFARGHVYGQEISPAGRSRAKNLTGEYARYLKNIEGHQKIFRPAQQPNMRPVKLVCGLYNLDYVCLYIALWISNCFSSY